MLGINRVVVGQSERALVFRNKTLQTIWEPGVYWFVDPLRRVDVKVYDLTDPAFDHPQLDALLRDNRELIERHLDVTEIGDLEIGLVYRQGRLADVIAPGERAVYWKGPIDVEVQVVDVSDSFEIDRGLVRQLLHPRSTRLATAVRNGVYATEVADGHVGMLIVDGELQRTLSPGRYAFWQFHRSIKVEHVETRLQAMEVSGQEILTRDRVSLRINLSASYRVTDVVKARTAARDFSDTLYRELQFALRQAVGTRTLDALLADKGQLDGVVHSAVVAKVGDLGLAVLSVGVKDIILPGDMKEILNHVVEAQKLAEANVIKRREETAATRSLLNTAKIMDENPTLKRLKELETLEKVAEKVERLTVFGGLDGVMNETVRIQLPDRG